MSQKLKPQTSEHLASPLGIITEANPLNFPEGATLDEENFYIKSDGSRVKRKGMNYDSAASPFEHVLPFSVEEDLTNFSYISPVDFSTITSMGVQVGKSYLTNINWLGSNYTKVIELGQNEEINAAYAGGYFFIPKVNDTITVIDANSNDVDSELLVRDFWGEIIEDAPFYEKTSSTDTHLYNVVNGGWWGERLEEWKTANGGAFPSLNKIPSFGVTETGWSASKVKDYASGSTRAPYGRMIINPFDRGASRKSALVEAISGDTYALSEDKTTGYITDVVTFAGRVWYSGIREVDLVGKIDTSPRFESTIFFSKVVNHYKEGLSCFQEADPTGDLVTPPLPTDGGHVSSSETGKIVKLSPFASGLLVFSDRGIWFLSSSGGVITPTNLSLAKVSSVGTSNKGSIVSAEDKVYFWNKGGIYVVDYDQNVGITVSCLSENTIQTLFNNIGERSVITVTGTYNEADKTVSWLYASTEGSSHKDTQLIYNTAINCFYKYKFWLGDNRRLLGLIPMPLKYDPQVLGYRYVVADISNGSATIRLAALTDNEYSDFGEYPVKAFAATAYNLLGSSQKQKRISHISTHMKNLDGGFVEGNIESESSCLLSARWSFSSDIRSGKWTRPIEIYRKRRALVAGGNSTVDRYDQEVITTKTRIRGSGSAVSLMFQSHDPKACHLLGWGVEFTTDKR